MGPKTASRQIAGYKWLLVGILFTISALNYGDRSAISSILPLLQREFHLSDVQLGLLGTAFLWSYALAAPSGGFLADRLSRSKMVTLSLAGWSLATLLSAACQHFYQLVVCRMLLGVTESFYIPAAAALIADYHRPDTRGTAMALNVSGMSVGLIASASLSGWLAEMYGWRLPLLLLGGAGIAMAALAWFWVKDAEEPAATVAVAERQRLSEKLALLFSNRTYLLLLGEVMLTSSGAWMFWTWLPLYYHEEFHMNLGASGFSGTFMLQSAAVAAIIIGGCFSDRIGASHPRRRMLTLVLFYFASVPFLAVFRGHPSYWVLSSGIFLFSFVRTLGQANEDPIVCELLPPRVRSTGFALLLTSAVAGGGCSVLVAGYIKQHYGLNLAFLCVSGMVLVAALLSLIAYLFYFNRDLARTSHHAPEA
jgi:predicted MFS family arabinose efflux permease